jgi:hypothetical protein
MDASQYLLHVDENGETERVRLLDKATITKDNEDYFKNNTAVVAKVSVDEDALILDGVRSDGLQVRIPKRDLVLALSKLM